MKVSFDKSGAPAQNPEPATLLPAPMNAGPVAVQRPVVFGDDADSITISDVSIPRLNLVQRIGELSTMFKPEEVVLAAQLVLPQPARFVVLGFKPMYYAEKVQGGEQGQIVGTEAEVAKVGGTLDWNESKSTEKPLYQRVATALILIEKHDSLTDAGAFPYECEEKKYAIAQWSMRGTAFTGAALPIRTARKMGCLRGGYTTGVWELKTMTKKFGSNSAVVPVLKAAGPTSEGFRQFATRLVAGEA